jgi:hypothetical protein
LFRNSKYKWAWRFFRRPILPFAFQLTLLMPLILATDVGKAAGVYGFALPWLLPVFGILNLPYLASAFRAFRLDLATRRNHVLEHATILNLEANSGRRFSGRADRNGFRVSGHTSPKEIKAAFDQVRRVLQSGEPLSYISPRCGSNIATALGFGMGLLLLVAVGSVMLRPPLAVRAGALIAVVLLFVGLRTGIGNIIQHRCFMAVDFVGVSLRDVRSARQELFDRGPVHFVETIILSKSTGPPSKPGRRPPTSQGAPPH